MDRRRLGFRNNNKDYIGQGNNNGPRNNFQNRRGPQFDTRINNDLKDNRSNLDGNNKFNSNRFQNRNIKTRDTLRKNNNRRRNIDRNRQNEFSSNQWYKISIPHASEVNQEYIISSLQKLINDEFTPFNYSTEGHTIIFYVQGDGLSSAIRSLTRRITTPSGQKLLIIKDKSFVPQINIDEDFLMNLKSVMSNRYDTITKSLNLSSISSEKVFLDMRIFFTLQKNVLVKEVVKIICDNIPDLMALDLSDNKIQLLDCFVPLVIKCKYLKSLNLNKNNIINVTELDNLKGLNLEEINLENNPFKKNQKDNSAYTSLIRSRFPKIIKLDGVCLPPPICFDLEENTNLPETKQNYIPDSTNEFVSNFVKQYFNYFDSEDRQTLLPAYHDQALFSLTISKLANLKKNQQFDNILYTESRNLLKIKDDRRLKQLKQGKANVVSALSHIPKTEHFMDSFKIDVPWFNQYMICLIINGLFKTKEARGNASQLRAFTRNFLIVPHNDGFAIINDLFLMTNPTVEQINQFRSNTKESNLNNEGMIIESIMDENMVSNVESCSLNQNQISSNKDQLVIQFGQITGMNAEYANQCLRENDYNPQKAMNVFKELSSRGLIPSEAFTK